MKKYLQKRKLIICTCDYCGIQHEKPISEFDRNKKLNRKNFCSRSCCGQNNIKNLGNNIGNNSNGGRKKDEYSEFKEYLRSAKRRFKNLNITIGDIKSVWDQQNGICVYSGIKMIHKSKSKIYKPSLDRINSDIGYMKGNIQFVSMAINFMKNNMSHDETITLCKLIADNYKFNPLRN